ncbi:MAG: aspartate-semialdehyde dehydrogenase [Myxococcota bacterium]|jgi:aspartate-semialdehyde dehydrogenase
MVRPNRVGVVGATGALGAELVSVLDRVAWRPGQLVPLGRASTTRTHVEWGGERVAVELADVDDVDDLDLLFLAAPAEVSLPLARAAIDAGVAVVDCSGEVARAGLGPLVVPWVNPEQLQEMDAVALPGAAAMFIASIIGPLARAGVIGRVTATVLEPASTAGRDGIAELSGQVVALLNSQTPRRRVFPEGLAFDLVPAEGTIRADGWTDMEARASDEVRSLVPGAHRPDVTLVRVPVFSGVGGTIVITTDQQLLPELVTRILADGGVKLPEHGALRSIPRPRRVDGKPFAHVGRLRLAEASRSLHLWASMDNLRTGATAAVAAGGALLQQRG